MLSRQLEVFAIGFLSHTLSAEKKVLDGNTGREEGQRNKDALNTTLRYTEMG
jgi:hypothetical protein